MLVLSLVQCLHKRGINICHSVDKRILPPYITQLSEQQELSEEKNKLQKSEEQVYLTRNISLFCTLLVRNTSWGARISCPDLTNQKTCINWD